MSWSYRAFVLRETTLRLSASALAFSAAVGLRGLVGDTGDSFGDMLGAGGRGGVGTGCGNGATFQRSPAAARSSSPIPGPLGPGRGALVRRGWEPDHGRGSDEPGRAGSEAVSGPRRGRRRRRRR